MLVPPAAAHPGGPARDHRASRRHPRELTRDHWAPREISVSRCEITGRRDDNTEPRVGVVATRATNALGVVGDRERFATRAGRDAKLADLASNTSGSFRRHRCPARCHRSPARRPRALTRGRCAVSRRSDRTHGGIDLLYGNTNFLYGHTNVFNGDTNFFRGDRGVFTRLPPFFRRSQRVGRPSSTVSRTSWPLSRLPCDPRGAWRVGYSLKERAARIGSP